MKNLLILGTLALSYSCASFSWGQTNVPAPAPVPLVGGRILLNAKSFYSIGEEVVLEITLKNTGKTPLGSRYTNLEYFYEINVTAGGRTIKSLLPSEIPQFSGYQVIIPPQGQRKGYLYLSRAFDLSREDSYTVTVSKKSRQAETKNIFTITSQPLEFRIAGPPTKFGYWEDTVAAAPQLETPPTNRP